MKSSLPSLISAVVLTATATPASLLAQMPVEQPGAVPLSPIPIAVDPAAVAGANASPAPAPSQLLADAIDLLGRRRSVAAKLRFQAHLYDRDVVGSGEYLQGPTSSRLVRYALRMRAGAREVDFLEVNDGIYLWRRVQYETDPDVERIDVDRVLAADQQAIGVADPASLLSLYGLGGLLSSLARNFEFNQLLPAGRLGNAPVYGIVGRWRTDVLKNRYGVESVGSLRPHVPHEVVLYLGRDDGFPYLIEFRRLESRAGQGGVTASRVLLKLDLFEVRFDVPLDASQFQFSAKQYVDVTDRAIELRAADRQ